MKNKSYATNLTKHFRNGNAKIAVISVGFIAFVITGNQMATAMVSDNQASKELRAVASEVQADAYRFYFDEDNPKRPTTPVLAERSYAARNADSNISVKVEEKENCFTVSATHKNGKELTMKEVCSD